MARICLEAEKIARGHARPHFLDRVFTRIDQSIAMAALFTAYHLKVKAIASLTAVRLDRAVDVAPQLRRADLRPDPEFRSRYQMTLYREVYPLLMRRRPSTATNCCARPSTDPARTAGWSNWRPHRAHHRRTDRQARAAPTP
jgi:pyruvate kinase